MLLFEVANISLVLLVARSNLLCNFRYTLSVLCLWPFNTARLLNLSSPIVDLSHVFRRRADEYERSLRNACNNNCRRQLCQAFDFVKRICKSRCALLVIILSSGQVKFILIISVSGTLKNKPKQTSDRAISLPALPPPRSLSTQLGKVRRLNLA